MNLDWKGADSTTKKKKKVFVVKVQCPLTYTSKKVPPVQRTYPWKLQETSKTLGKKEQKILQLLVAPGRSKTTITGTQIELHQNKKQVLKILYLLLLFGTM